MAFWERNYTIYKTQDGKVVVTAIQNEGIPVAMSILWAWLPIVLLILYMGVLVSRTNIGCLLKISYVIAVTIIAMIAQFIFWGILFGVFFLDVGLGFLVFIAVGLVLYNTSKKILIWWLERLGFIKAGMVRATSERRAEAVYLQSQQRDQFF